MEYTDIIKRLKKDYELTPQDVFFAILCANGCGRAECFLHIYQPQQKSASSIINGAAKLVKDKPNIIKLINDLKERNKIIPLTADLEAGRNKRKEEEKAKADGWNSNQTPEENLKRIIEKELYKLEPKEKIDAARNLAKLYGVQDDAKETRHYYLPLSCKHCKLYIEAEDKNRRSKPGS